MHLTSKNVAIATVILAFGFLNVDGYWIGVNPSFNSPTLWFAQPFDGPLDDDTFELSQAISPWLGRYTRAAGMAAWEHGWPVHFLARDIRLDATQKLGRPGNQSSRWPIDTARSLRFNPFWMLVDLSILGLVVTGLITAIPVCENDRFTFSLRFLLIAITLVAAGQASGIMRMRLFYEVLAVLLVFTAIFYSIIGLARKFWSFVRVRNSKRVTT